VLAALAAAVAACSPVQGEGEDELTIVFVVRHAEKQWEDGDPPLSDVGWRRASELLHVTEDAGVTVLYGTQYARTTQTLEPIANRLGLEINTHDAADSDGLAREILSEHRGQVVLVSGHSNTVPEIVAALGAPRPPPIDDSSYDDLYVVSIPSGAGEATSLHLHFGQPTVSP